MPALGIDLGRGTCSVVVQLTDAKFTFRVEPIVTLTTKNEWLVGEDARRAAAAGTGEVVWDLIMLQGHKMSDFSPTQLASWPFRLVQGVAGKALIEFHAKAARLPTVFSPEEVLAVLLARVRQVAEQRAGCTLDEAVLTIPVSYNYTQRRALHDACAMAGLRAQRLIVSSTAAGLAHALGLNNVVPMGQLVLVMDVGAGSVDVSLISKLSTESVEVKAAVGDSAIGGIVLTERIVDHLLCQCNRQAAVATTSTLNRMRRASQLAKKILSSSDAASVQLQLDTGPFTGSITRTQFEYVCRDAWDRIVELMQLVLSEGHATCDQVNEVVLCGGSAVIPAVHRVVEKLFPAATIALRLTDELQAHGAVMYAMSLLDASRTAMLLDVTPLAFGVQRIGTRDVTILVPANVRVRATGDNMFYVGSQVRELAYHVLEGRHLGQTVANPHTWTTAPHCLGILRTLPPPLTLTTVPKPVVTKLTIAFVLSEDRQLTASIADLATKQPVTTTFLGDDSVLPRDEITRVKIELDRAFGAHRVAVGESPMGSNQASVLNGSVSRTAVLKEYAETLRRMVETKMLVVPIGDDDARLVTAKIEAILKWLHSSPRDHTNNSTSTEGETSDSSDDLNHRDETLHAQLQELQRLHWSIAGAAAMAQLRNALG